MQYRSTTDEMLAARFDPQPWVTPDTGERWATEGSDSEVFDPCPEFIPSRDPYPWRVEVIDRTDMDLRAARDGERLSDPAWTTFWDASTERLVFDPRPEYARPEPNPILVAIRRAYSEGVNGATAASSVAEWVSGEMVDGDPESLIFYPEVKYTPTQIDHARKVLTRLANVYKED